MLSAMRFTCLFYGELLEVVKVGLDYYEYISKDKIGMLYDQFQRRKHKFSWKIKPIILGIGIEVGAEVTDQGDSIFEKLVAVVKELEGEGQLDDSLSGNHYIAGDNSLSECMYKGYVVWGNEFYNSKKKELKRVILFGSEGNLLGHQANGGPHSTITDFQATVEGNEVFDSMIMTNDPTYGQMMTLLNLLPKAKRKFGFVAKVLKKMSFVDGIGNHSVKSTPHEPIETVTYILASPLYVKLSNDETDDVDK